MPYIDPITGAYVADSLNALPPGYNQPSASDAANIAKMRAAITNQATQTPAPSSTPSFIQPIQTAMQNMPGAPVGQAAISMGSDMLGGLIGNLYGAYKGITGGEYGKGTDIVQQNAALAAQNLHYTPPTQQGQNLVSAINKLPEQITGSSMGIGPLPELMGMNYRFTPDDLRAGATSAITDVRNFPMDYANAKAGLLRDYPTLGSRAAGATDTATSIAKPLAEMAYNQIMETGGIKQPFGMPDIPVANFAVKPKGGNWPTNLGSTDRLSLQGNIGMHLADTQISDPGVKWFENLPRQVRWDWERYVDRLASEHGNLTPQQKQAYAEEFTKDENTKREAQGQPLITLPSQYEAIAPQYNSWVMGPYQKYITNQMGTGLSSDPLVQAFNETSMPVNEFSKLVDAPDYRAEGDVGRAENRRRDFVKELTRYGRNTDRLEEPQNVNVGKQTATSPAGIAVENALDAALYPKGTYAFKPEEGYPHASKLSSDAIINDFIHNHLDETTALPIIQKKVLQDLIAGNLDVNKLSNLTPAVVARQLIKDEMARQKALQSNKDMADSYRIARNKELPTDLTYPDGSKMVVFTKADYDKDPLMLTRDLSQITKDLHQCIGSGCHGTDEYPRHGPVLEPHTGKPPKGSTGNFRYASYFEGLQKGTREIASLKDPQGVSQFTANIMIRGGDLKGTPRAHRQFVKNWIEREIRNGNENEAEWAPILRNFDNESYSYMQAVLQNTPNLEDAFNEYFKPEPEKYITEMKGYDNGEIKPEYIPHVKEWLNQQSDLSRVDMDKLEGEIFDLQNSHSANNLLESKHDDWNSVAIENLLIDARDNKLLPRFFDDKDFEKLAGDRQVDLTEDPIHKSGGLTPVAQRAYEGVSQQIVDTFEDDYVREAFSNGDNPALNAIIREIQERPNGYGLGNYSPAVRSQVIQALRNEAQRNGNLNQMADEMQNMEPENANEFQP